MHAPRTRCLALALASGAVLACSGTIQPAAPGQSGPSGAPDDRRGGAAPGSPGASAGSPALSGSQDLRALTGTADDVGGGLALRGLTRTEYDNTVAALLGDTSTPALQWGVEVKGESGFLEPRATSAKEVGEYMDAAATLAARAKANLPRLTACNVAQMGEDACARAFVTSFGRRAFRRPLLPEEIADWFNVWSGARKAQSLPYEDALSLVVEGMLQSPSFMYHWELGPQPPHATRGVVRLTPYEVAARLSYFLTQSPPDDALAAAADSGKILEAGELRAQAQRLLGSARARALFQDFLAQMLNLSEFGFSAEPLDQAMDRARRAFVDRALWSGGGTPKELLLDSSFFVNADLARVLGAAAVKGDALVATALDPSRRFGLLTHADFLIKTSKGTETLPPRRGRAIWENLLCGALPSGVPPVPPPIDQAPGETTREFFEREVEPVACASACHKLLDHAGYAFENYGGAAWRDRDPATGKPIDATGALALPFGGTVSYGGPRAFVESIAGAEELRQCLPRQMFRMAVGRQETVADVASLQAAYQAFLTAGQDLKALASAVVATHAFSNRRLNQGEVAQ